MKLWKWILMENTIFVHPMENFWGTALPIIENLSLKIFFNHHWNHAIILTNQPCTPRFVSLLEPFCKLFINNSSKKSIVLVREYEQKVGWSDAMISEKIYSYLTRGWSKNIILYLSWKIEVLQKPEVTKYCFNTIKILLVFSFEIFFNQPQISYER